MNQINKQLVLNEPNSALIVYEDLEKRNKWLWASLAVGGLVLALAAGLAPVWAPAWVSGLFGKVIVSLVLAASTAIGVTGTVGAVAWNKRDGNTYYSHGDYISTNAVGEHLYFYDVSTVHGAIVHDTIRNFNNFTYTAFTVGNNSIDAADGLIAKSDLGNHLIRSTPDIALSNVIADIALQHETQCIGECALEALYGGKNSTLKKRTSYYKVNWASYNYDVWSNSDAENETDNPDVSYSEVESNLNQQYKDQGDPDTWKYCMCVDGSYTGAYDSLGNEVGLVGELYTNTYGGIDGYCDTSTCGAQCSDDGC
ncbi:hypothetical protein WICMUC_000765 [Wickerhamomyces mucosus]|uniref:Uncharacterized protein n=1 Tax=Wickerhamomyces mucosus TaxID=1378264 RepID=A0A9P8PYQ9_9ASCO|nr:hypothetical protein WICMUC_000765 [Wickerhamomyces mucosus]